MYLVNATLNSSFVLISLVGMHGEPLTFFYASVVCTFLKM